MKAMFRSIQFAFTVAMGGVALAAMVLVAVLIYNKTSGIMEETFATNTEQVVSQVANTINVYVQDMMDVSNSITGDINTYNSSIQRLQEVLRTAQRVRRDIASVTIVNSRGMFVAYAPAHFVEKEGVNVLKQETFPQHQLSDEDYYFSPPHVQNLFEGQYTWVVTLYRNITMHDIGSSDYNLTLMIDMNFSSIDQYCSELRIGRRGYVFILDDEDNIIYHPRQHVIYAGMKSEDLDFIHGKGQGTYIQGDQVITIEPIEHTDWKLVGISYMDDYATVYQEIIGYIGGVFFIVLILVLLLAAMVSQRISRPIRRLAERMEGIEDQSLDDYVREEGFVEVKSLSNSYNKMIEQIKELMERVKWEEEQLRKSELRALQAQINPHFLYNTLDSILWMCERNDGERAVTMVSALSRLFRISISKGADLITIREELVHAESYLTIQKIRYRDQFEYRIEADEALLDYKCLKIIIQPFLENAIYHGIDRMVDKGLLVVRITEQDGKILIRISDNGLGIPEDILETILQDKPGGNVGIGVSNVNNRIQIYFGKEYGVQIESKEDEGTVVNIWIPKLEGDEELS